MSHANTPAKAGQINELLSSVLPAIEKEYQRAMGIINAPVVDSTPMRLMAELDEAMSRQRGLELIQLEARQFFDQMRTGVAYYDVEWGTYFSRWYRYTLFVFAGESLERRMDGLGYALPKRLMPQFEAFGAEQRAELFQLLSRPYLRLSDSPTYTNVIVFQTVAQ